MGSNRDTVSRSGSIWCKWWDGLCSIPKRDSSSVFHLVVSMRLNQPSISSLPACILWSQPLSEAAYSSPSGTEVWNAWRSLLHQSFVLWHKSRFRLLTSNLNLSIQTLIVASLQYLTFQYWTEAYATLHHHHHHPLWRVRKGRFP